MSNRTNLDAARDLVADGGAWLAALNWLIVGAFALTIGSFLGAVLDSYTSLCVIGAMEGHIGSQAACPDVYGWDTRTFPLAVDMGWGGALLAVIHLARTIGMGSWRWWVVTAFEIVTAAFTVGGNAYHGAVLDGVTAGMPELAKVAVSCVASAVPGIVAVGSGFTLSVLISSRQQTPASGDLVAIDRAEAPAAQPATGARGDAAPTIEVTIDRGESAASAHDRSPHPRPTQRSSGRRAKRSLKATSEPERPPIDRLVDAIEDIARERSIAPEDVPPAAAIDRLGDHTDRSAITLRAWVRQAKATIAERGTPLSIVSSQENA